MMVVSVEERRRWDEGRSRVSPDLVKLLKWKSFSKALSWDLKSFQPICIDARDENINFNSNFTEKIPFCELDACCDERRKFQSAWELLSFFNLKSDIGRESQLTVGNAISSLEFMLAWFHWVWSLTRNLILNEEIFTQFLIKLTAPISVESELQSSYFNFGACHESFQLEMATKCLLRRRRKCVSEWNPLEMIS